jgi:LPXTG-site transpeptidase (sortase) family protein
VAIALVAFGLWGYIQKYQAEHAPPLAADTPEIVTYSTETPSENKPADCEPFRSGSAEPKKIVIAGLGIDGCIQKVGVDKENNRIAVPTNIHVAGWFVDSVIPGLAGVSIIDGHVLGNYNDAIFKDIKKLEAGDIVTIEYGDGTKKNFEVVTSDSYSAEETSTQQYIQLDGVTHQLTLITCDGVYDATSNTYDRRAVVRARLTSEAGSTVNE